jgi:hypothetical protein
MYMVRESFHREHCCIETAPSEASIRAFFDLANSYFGVEDPEVLIGPEYSIEQILKDVKDGKRFIQTITVDGTTVGGSIATYVNADRAAEVWHLDTPAVLLEYTILPEDMRGKEYVLQLRSQQEAWTREKECQVQIGEVEFTNIASCVALLKQGFVLFRAEYPAQEGAYFVAKRNITETKEPRYETYKEVSFADTEHIETMMQDGWVGIDLKNLDDVTDFDVKHWVLILAR